MKFAHQTIVLPANYRTVHGGIEIKWFIGDINFDIAVKLGCAEWIGNTGRMLKNSGAYWEAWGSLNGKAYQLAAWFDRETRVLSNITILDDEANYYYSKETVDLLKSIK